MSAEEPSIPTDDRFDLVYLEGMSYINAVPASIAGRCPRRVRSQVALRRVDDDGRGRAAGDRDDAELSQSVAADGTGGQAGAAGLRVLGRVEARELVERQAGEQRGHARHVAVVLARLVGAAEDHVLDVRRLDARRQRALASRDEAVTESFAPEYVPGLTVAPHASDRHAPIDVGGRLDTTTTWRMTIPDPAEISRIEEPYVKARIMAPDEYIGAIMTLGTERRGIYKNMTYLDQARVDQQVAIVLQDKLSFVFDRHA